MGKSHLGCPSVEVRKWTKGQVSGLRVRGGFEVDISWENGALKRASIQCQRGGILPIKSPVPLTITGGKILNNSMRNHFLQPMDPGSHLKHTQMALPKFDLGKQYTYYLSTETGDKIQLSAK